MKTYNINQYEIEISDDLQFFYNSELKQIMLVDLGLDEIIGKIQFFENCLETSVTTNILVKIEEKKIIIQTKMIDSLVSEKFIEENNLFSL